MNRTTFALPLALGILITTTASAEEPASRPGGAPTPLPVTSASSAPARPGPLAESPPAAPPAPPEERGRVGYVVGGLVSLAAGIPLLIGGAAMLDAKSPSGSCGGWGCLDFSETKHVFGGVTMGFGGAGVLAGTVLLGVAIARSVPSQDAKPETLVAPTITLGLGHVSARWTF